MKYQDPQLVDRLASEYVLGTLRGPARSRFERLCRQQTRIAWAVRDWEDRLLPVTLALKPVEPRAQVWNTIAAQLKFTQKRSMWASLFAPQLRAAWAAGIAVLAIALVWGVFLREPAPQSYAVIKQATGQELWRVEMFASGDRIVIRGAESVQADRSLELWALPEGKAPVSLGVMPSSGKLTRTLTQAQRLALAQSSKVAISVEPVGGSPTGAPTGPVIHVADVLMVG